MSVRPFDTHEYVQELIKGGFSQQLAEANMHALVKALDFTLENHVLAKLDTFATKKELNEVAIKLEKEIKQVEHRLEIKIQNLDHKIDNVFLKSVVINGICTSSIVTIACSILGFIIKF